MATRTTTLTTLPYEILSSILSHLPTHLLPHTLIFESFLPAERTNVPYYECLYRGSLRCLDLCHFDKVLGLSLGAYKSGRFGEPQSREETRGLGGWGSFFVPVAERVEVPAEGEEEVVDWLRGVETPVQTVILRAEETFVELCPQASLVLKGGAQGVLTTVVGVFDGVRVRLSREWLGRMARMGRERNGGEWEGEWVQVGKRGDVAIRMRVYGDDLADAGAEDEGVGRTVTYRVKYEEIMVQTGLLLMVLEQSREEEMAYGPEARALVLGGF
ncbi:hypothetical protein BJ508DRAFT_364119 [Ascobolus immersus RN42]|uniref:F-box domain-containing protein n=1 Tax=Ascobolus immersus RN42 TaxID=1160509 RepID=A0A3N4HZN5_ASCIM|nr:hypothetical protein BJ508DRAFT_364119 [Ascobolus immersus RN42]